MVAHEAQMDPFDRSRQHRRGVSHAGTELEGALASPAGLTDGWTAEVRGRLAELTTAFRRHVDQSEGPDGLLQEILRVAPHLAPGVDRARRDHQAILDELSRVGAVVDLKDDDDVVSVVREGGQLLLQRITRHRQHGADLIYDAYSVDVEGGG